LQIVQVLNQELNLQLFVAAVAVDSFQVLFKLLKEQLFLFFQLLKQAPPQPIPTPPSSSDKNYNDDMCMHLVKISVHLSQQFI
jgi:hypothetical protein